MVSTGCIGNRIYTDVREDELYVEVPKDLPMVAEEAQTLGSANAKLSEYDRERRQVWATE